MSKYPIWLYINGAIATAIIMGLPTHPVVKVLLMIAAGCALGLMLALREDA
jgi:uncharacterized membrane protein